MTLSGGGGGESAGLHGVRKLLIDWLCVLKLVTTWLGIAKINFFCLKNSTLSFKTFNWLLEEMRFWKLWEFIYVMGIAKLICSVLKSVLCPSEQFTDYRKRCSFCKFNKDWKIKVTGVVRRYARMYIVIQNIDIVNELFSQPKSRAVSQDKIGFSLYTYL